MTNTRICATPRALSFLRTTPSKGWNALAQGCRKLPRESELPLVIPPANLPRLVPLECSVPPFSPLLLLFFFLKQGRTVHAGRESLFRRVLERKRTEGAYRSLAEDTSDLRRYSKQPLSSSTKHVLCMVIDSFFENRWCTLRSSSRFYSDRSGRRVSLKRHRRSRLKADTGRWRTDCIALESRI